MIGVSVAVYLLLVTCYLVLMFFVLCDLVNCRVVWGLDHKAGAGRVVGY